MDVKYSVYTLYSIYIYIYIEEKTGGSKSPYFYPALSAKIVVSSDRPLYMYLLFTYFRLLLYCFNSLHTWEQQMTKHILCYRLLLRKWTGNVFRNTDSDTDMDMNAGTSNDTIMNTEKDIDTDTGQRKRAIRVMKASRRSFRSWRIAKDPEIPPAATYSIRWAHCRASVPRI